MKHKTLSPYALPGIRIKDLPFVIAQPESIIAGVCKFFGVSEDEVLGQSRKTEIVRPRHVICYLLRQHTELSYAAIGKLINRDHTTVHSSERALRDEMDVNSDLREMVELLSPKQKSK